MEIRTGDFHGLIGRTDAQRRTNDVTLWGCGLDLECHGLVRRIVQSDGC